MKNRQQLLSEKAEVERLKARAWLLPFLQVNQPRDLTKDELRAAAMRKLSISKNSFDFAGIDVIERTGRQDWYEPMRRKHNRKH